MPSLPGALASDENPFDSRANRDAARLGIDGGIDTEAMQDLTMTRSASNINAMNRDQRRERRLQRMAARSDNDPVSKKSKLGHASSPKTNGSVEEEKGRGLESSQVHGSPMHPLTSPAGRRVMRSSRGSSRKPGAPGNVALGVVPQFSDQAAVAAMRNRTSQSSRRRDQRESSQEPAPPRRGPSGINLMEGGWKASVKRPLKRQGSYREVTSSRRNESSESLVMRQMSKFAESGEYLPGRIPSDTPENGAASRQRSGYPEDRKLISTPAAEGDTVTRHDGTVDGAGIGDREGDGGSNDSDGDGDDEDEQIDDKTATYFSYLDLAEGRRRRVCDLAFLCAMLSIVAMVASIEVRFHMGKDELSNWIRIGVSVLTVLTIVNVFRYHRLEFLLLQHRHILPKEMTFVNSPSIPLLLFEIVIIALHPIPFFEGTYEILDAEIEDGVAKPLTSQQGTITPSHPIPIDVLGVFVFFRAYLVLRVLKFHGALYGPAARFIGALNNVDFDLRFMLKALVNEHPFRILGAALLYVLIAVSYSIWAIERERDQFFFLDDSLWFLVVTMTTVGYGDIIPSNHLSRILTVIAASAGVTVTALLVAVMSAKLTLSKGEARVVHLLNKDRLRRELYENAAKVIQAALRFRREMLQGKGRRGCRVRLFESLRQWRTFKRGLSVYMTDNLASRDMALDDVMVEIVRLSGITEMIEDRFDEFGDRFDEMIEGQFADSGGGAAGGQHAIASAAAVEGVEKRLADLEHRSKVLTTAVTKTLRKVEAVESTIAATVEEKVAERTRDLEAKIDTLIGLVKDGAAGRPRGGGAFGDAYGMGGGGGGPGGGGSGGATRMDPQIF